jgi:8-oxo-dGTP pyrophosphatase MutT (NUDIX family)
MTISRWKPNVTVAAVIEQDGKFLLVEEHTAQGLRLNTPAGHLDPGESPIEGCARETLEETAHAFTPTALIGIYMARSSHRTGKNEDDVIYMRFAFAGILGPKEAGRPLDQGIVRTVWMSADEIRASVARHRSPLLLKSVEDHLAGRRYPLDLIHVHDSVVR